MSTSSNEDYSEKKITRGEKCLFVHLIITFSFILLLVIIYFIHLCVVNHSVYDVWKVSRRTEFKQIDSFETANLPVGYIYLKYVLPLRLICNVVLLRERWSVGPGHCAAARSHPNVAHLSLEWHIRYKPENNSFRESKIERTVLHPQFSREEFLYNIGLFEHVDPIIAAYFTFPVGLNLNENTLLANNDNLNLFGWVIRSSTQEDEPELKRHHVVSVPSLACTQYLSSIIDLRHYEYCVLPYQRNSDFYTDHGSVLVIETNIMGFFGWGEKSGKGTPCVIVGLQFFKEWLISVTS